MLEHFLSFVEQQRLFNRRQTLLVAVSGGVDSVVLCDLVHKSGASFGIAHCNFQLRGKESEGDEQFVKALAGKYKVPFHSFRFDTPGHAEARGISLQMAARELRYEWFERLRKQFHYRFVAVAHHQDDETETFFINLLRGTGIAGMHGILPRQKNIIRPLLFTNRVQIEQYALKQQLAWREDSSNQSEKYLRNKIRLRLIPLLKSIHPGVQETIAKDVQRLRGVEQVFSEHVLHHKKKLLKKQGKEYRILLKELNKLHPVTTWLYELLKDFSFNEATIQAIAQGLNRTSGKMFYSHTHRLTKDRDYLIITQKSPDISSSKEYVLHAKNISVTIHGVVYSVQKQKRTRHFNINPSPAIASLDFDKLTFPLIIRNWKPGDFFYPLGMKHRKKLSDFFIDEKMPVTEKEQCMVLVSGKDIAWVIGKRIDNRFRIEPRTTTIYTLTTS